MGFDFGAFVRGLDAQARRAIPVATRRAYAPALSPNQIFSSVKPPVTPAGATAGLIGAVAGRTFTIPAIIDQGRKVFNPNDNIITSLQDLGSGLSNVIHGKPYLEGRSPQVPANARLEQYNPPGFDPSRPASLSAVVDTARQVLPRVGSMETEETFAGSSPAIERAYQQEKSRVAQLAAQDELAKKYRVADLTKAYNTAAAPEEKEKIGLEIWATTNPRLAQKLQPGQLGYEQVQSVAAAQSPLGGIMKAAGDMQFADKISFGAVPATDFGIGLKTPLTGVEIPSVPQVGVEEAFKQKVPGGFSFTEAAKMFEPKALSQTQQAILKRLFEQGIKK